MSASGILSDILDIIGVFMNLRIIERNSNFELLRIISMFMIVLLHSVYFGVQFKFHGGGDV